jgi:ribonuclease HII
MVSVGIDEVGRGSWAGPLVVGAVILNARLAGLRDSKVLTKAQRLILDGKIRRVAAACSLGWVWPEELDKLGLTAGTTLAINRALEQISIDYDEIIIDGHINFIADNPKSRTLIKADSLVLSVSAASIVAKVARDKYMEEMAKEYAEYGFNRHVGYGTKLHQDMINEYGICEIHRKSYKPIKLLIEKGDNYGVNPT